MIYLLLISCVWAFSYGLIKGNLTTLSPDFVAFTRMALAFAVFAPFFRKNSLTKKEFISFLGIGAIQYGLMYVFFIRSCQHLPAHLIVLFTACTPIYVTLLDDLVHKHFQIRHFIAAGVAFLGIAVLQYQNLSFNVELKGFFLVQLSDLCFAFGQVFYKKIKKQETADSKIYAVLFLGGALMTGLTTTLFSGWNSFFSVSIKQASLLVYLGIIASGLCFFGWNKASLQVKTATLAIFNNVKIPLGVLVSIVFFKEQADIPSLSLSCLFLLIAFLLTNKKKKNPPLPQRDTPDILFIKEQNKLEARS